MSTSANSILNAYFKKVSDILKSRDKYLKNDPFKKKKDSVKEIIKQKLKEAIEKSNCNTGILNSTAQDSIKKIAEARNNLIKYIDSSFDNYYQIKNNDTANKIAELTTQKDDYIERVNNLKNGVLDGEYSDGNIEAGKNITELSKDSADLKNKRDDKEKERKALEASLEKAKKDLVDKKSILSTLEDLETSEQNYRDELETLKENPTENKEEIERLEAELASIIGKKENYGDKEYTLEEINKTLYKISELEKNIDDCNFIWTNCQQELVRINNEIQTKEKKISELNEKIITYDNEIDNCKNNLIYKNDNYKNDLQKAKNYLSEYCKLVNNFSKEEHRQELVNCLKWIGSAPDIENPTNNDIITPLKKIFDGIPNINYSDGSIELLFDDFEAKPPLKNINIEENDKDIQIEFTKDGEKTDFDKAKGSLTLNELFYVFNLLKKSKIEEKEEKLRNEILNSRVRFREIKAKLELIKEAYDNSANAAEEKVNKYLATDTSVSGKTEVGKDFVTTVAQIITNNLKDQLDTNADSQEKKDKTLEEFKEFIKGFLTDLKNDSVLNGVGEEDFPKIKSASTNGAEEFLSDDDKFVFTVSPYRLSTPKNLYKYLKDDQGLIYRDDVETVISNMLNREGFPDDDGFGGLKCLNFYNGLLSGKTITEKGTIGINSDTGNSYLYEYLAKSCDDDSTIKEYIKEFETLIR